MIDVQCKTCNKEFKTWPSYFKKGKGKYCSTSCRTTNTNLENNPSKSLDAKLKIKANHKNVSGINNPMFGKTGHLAPMYIDGRNSIKGDIWRKVALVNKPEECEDCGVAEKSTPFQVHHIDKNRKNNKLDNLKVLCVACHNKLHYKPRDDRGRFRKEF